MIFENIDMNFLLKNKKQKNYKNQKIKLLKKLKNEKVLFLIKNSW